MRFLLLAKDHPDALQKRLACREEHLALIARLQAEGYLVHGGPLLSDAGTMIGSMLIGEFDNRDAMQEIWLQHEPFVTQQVWETVEIYPYQVGPSFL